MVLKAVKLPSGNYRVQISVNGKRESVTRATAAQARKDALAMQASGDIKSSPLFGDCTLREACREYIDLRRPVLSPSTIRGYSQITENRFQSIMDYPLSAIDSKTVQKAVNLDSSHLSAKTVKNSYGFISSVIREKNGRTLNVALPQIVEKDAHFLDPEEIPKFLDTIMGTKHEIAYLLALHGLRASEVLAVGKESISSGIIHIRGSAVLNEYNVLEHKKTNKNRTSRRDVPVMIDRLSELVDAAPDGLLVHAAETRLSNNLKKLCLCAGLPPVTMHGLRHTFASLCYHLKLSEMETMRLGGWSNPETMRRIYTHLAKKDNNESEMKLKAFYSK